MKFKELIETLPCCTESVTVQVEGEKEDSMIYPFGMIAEKLGDADIIEVSAESTFNTVHITILPEGAADYEA